MDTFALNRLQLELHELNVQRWLKLPRIQQIFRTMPHMPRTVNKGTEKLNAKAPNHGQVQEMLQHSRQPIMGSMAIPQTIQKMVNGYLARFKSTSQLLSETLKAIHPGVVGQKGGCKAHLFVVFILINHNRGIIFLNLYALQKTIMHA